MTDVALARIPTPPTASPRRWAAVLLVAAAAYVMAGAIPTLSSLRRTSPTTRSARTDARRTQTHPAGIDGEATANSVRHQVVPMRGHPGTLVASDRDYRVTFDRTGFAVAAPGATPGLGVSLRTAARGGHELRLTAGPWRALSSGAERALGSSMREVVSVRSGEVEWDVVMATAPPGHGDLALSAALNGAGRAVSDTEGAWVSLTRGGRLRIGALVVKDATGRVLHRALPQVDGRHLQLVVPEHVMSGARYPVTLDPTVGPEKKVSGPSVTQPGSDIAFDGTNYLVVWTDFRNGAEDIYGARVQPNGTVLDPGGFPISTAVGKQYLPVVAYSGVSFLVLWTDYRSSSTNSDIYGSTVTSAGDVVDPLGTPFSTAAGSQARVDVAFNGTNALVVWQDDRSAPGTGAWDVYGSRWSATSGGLLDPGGIPISTVANPQYGPKVTYYGPNYLVVWQDTRSDFGDIYATRVTTAGVVLDGAGAPFSTASGVQTDPALAFDGKYVLIVWTDNRSGSGYDLYGARWDPASGLLDTGGLAISTVGGDQAAPSVAPDAGFLVVWEDHRTSPWRVYGARVARNGTLTDPDGFVINSTGVYNPAITPGASGKWATSYGRADDVTGIYFRTIPK